MSNRNFKGEQRSKVIFQEIVGETLVELMKDMNLQ